MKRKARHNDGNLILFPAPDGELQANSASPSVPSVELGHKDEHISVALDNLNVVLCGAFGHSRDDVQQTLSRLTALGFNVVSSLAQADTRELNEKKDAKKEVAPILDHLASLRRARFVWLHAPRGIVSPSAALELGFAHAHRVPVFCDLNLVDSAFRPLVNVVRSPRDFMAYFSDNRRTPLNPTISNEQQSTPPIRSEDIKDDIDVMLWSMKLYALRRFFRQRFWEVESEDSAYAERIEAFPRLESVAEHSWHVADTVSLLAGHFPELDVEHTVCLAIVHDKMEILTGDKNPIGRDGKGLSTHAFNEAKRLKKDEDERASLEQYLRKLRPSLVNQQETILLEMLESSTAEARFVKAVDKLQPVAFILLKKQGDLADAHLDFTLRYARKAVGYFPGLLGHFEELRLRLLQQIAYKRGCSVDELSGIGDQLSLYVE